MEVTPFRRLVAVTACMATIALLGFSIASGAQDTGSAHPTLTIATVTRQTVTQTATLTGVIDRGERTFYAGGQALASTSSSSNGSSNGNGSSSGGGSTGSNRSTAATTTAARSTGTTKKSNAATASCAPVLTTTTTTEPPTTTTTTSTTTSTTVVGPTTTTSTTTTTLPKQPNRSSSASGGATCTTKPTATVPSTARSSSGRTGASTHQSSASASSPSASASASGGGPSGAPGSNGHTSTLTSRVEPGSTVSQGQVLWTIDARPTVLLYGDGSLYRPLSNGVSDGADVQLLESALASLGYSDGGAMTVDDHFDAATKAAVEAWQTALGVTSNGTVNVSDVVFSPGAVRVIGAPADVGDIVTGATGILTVTGTDPVALVTAPEQGAGSVQAGQKVSITIGMQQPTPGTVAIVSRNATWSGATDSVATVQVAVTFDQPDQVGTLVDGTAVTATVDVKLGERDGLAVPIAALHADGDTASAVSMVTNTGTTREVEVHVGTYGDGYVEVSAPSLHEGDRVRLG